ncbi:MAG TPA: thiamine diphosphokinase [Candidatus Limnocylindrales bacterium]|nr:thiamine diphosphokinase [Candidatus Limnocylindrales bacterium]
MRAVVVAHGDVATPDRDIARAADLVIAADGGALALAEWGIVPHFIVGDLDSLGASRASEIEAQGATVISFPVAKDRSDLELALRHALDAGADEVVLLGILGGARVDHALVNAMLLADPEYRARGVRATYGATQLRALHGGESMDLMGAAGDTVTLLPVAGDARGVRTHGLRYPLDGGSLPFGRSLGLSNEIASVPARVSIQSGVMLVIEIAQGGNT